MYNRSVPLQETLSKKIKCDEHKPLAFVGHISAGLSCELNLLKIRQNLHFTEKSREFVNT